MVALLVPLFLISAWFTVVAKAFTETGPAVGGSSTFLAYVCTAAPGAAGIAGAYSLVPGVTYPPGAAADALAIVFGT